jgi:biopolymer transport protein ExbD
LDRKPMSLAQIEAQLVRDFKGNPNLIVYIRADENGLNKHLYALIDGCQTNGITRYSLRTQPPATTRKR